MISHRRWLTLIFLLCVMTVAGFFFAFAQYSSLAAYNHLVATTYQLPSYSDKPVRLIVHRSSCNYLQPDFFGDRWINRAVCPQCVKMADDILARYAITSGDDCPGEDSAVMEFTPLTRP